jgi:exonuclease VII large subunit
LVLFPDDDFFSDDLFLCEACEASDATLGLMRSSGKHAEDHPLIRCQAPKQDKDATFSTEQRLGPMSLEDRLDNMQSRIETIEQHLRQLAEANRVDNTHSRIETMEQLLRQLAEANRVDNTYSRMDKIEQLLRQLAEATVGSSPRT